MMGNHYLFVMWDGGGTVPPELGIARRLIDRGHRVTVLGEGTLEEEAREAGCAFVEYRYAFSRASRRPEDDPIADFDATNPMAAIRGARDVLMCGRAEDFSRDVRETAAGRQFDAVVVDAFLLGAMPGAQATGLPVAAMNPGPEMRPAPGKPPGGLGLKPSSNPFAKLRNNLMKVLMTRVFAPGAKPVNAARADGGLEPLAHPFLQYDELERYLMLTSADFDFTPDPMRPNMTYVGPQLDDPGWAATWQPKPTEGPLVLVTLGSTYQAQERAYQRAVDAFRGLSANGLVTLGHAFDDLTLDAPDNVEVVASAPHNEVLPHTAAAVVHGGHGTVMKTLAAGRPMVVVPLGRDQFDNGARVEVAGAGIMVKKPSAKNIRRALDEVLHDGAYRSAAERMAAQIHREVEEDLAVQELESLCGVAQATIARAS